MTRPCMLINEALRIDISLLGAEIQGIRAMLDDTEYLFNGDERYWKRRAPLLFPIVGKLRNDTYTHAGATYYPLTQHGFARDSVFELQSSDDTSAHFLLSASDETKKIYPFDFDLYVHYKLIGARLHVTYELTHVFGEPLPYMLGTHPAFLLGEGGNAPVVQMSEPLPQAASQLKNGLLEADTVSFPHESTSLTLTDDTFAHDALIFKNYTPKKIRLARRDGKSVTIESNDFPHTALWSKPGSPFVCIEHWSGHADTLTSSDELIKKDGVRFLSNGTVHYTLAMSFE